MDVEFDIKNDTHYRKLGREIKDIQHEIDENMIIKTKIDQVLEWIWIVE